VSAAHAAAGTLTMEELHGFYAGYGEALDEERLDVWAAYFSEPCLYQIIPRENFEQGFELCTMQADSKGMILDRVQGIRRTQKFIKRSCRRFLTGTRVVGTGDGLFEVRQNVLVVQTLLDQPSQILLCGVAHDLLRREEEGLRFRQRIVVSDTEILNNSLIFPV
jgi:3-phenylpropionate/cinnamic acid dioxygenase small subunit